MTTTETPFTAEPARSLYIALQEAKRVHVELVAAVNRLIDAQDAGQDVDDETYWAANDAADAAERDYVAIQSAFNVVAARIVAAGPGYQHV